MTLHLEKFGNSGQTQKNNLTSCVRSAIINIHSQGERYVAYRC